MLDFPRLRRAVRPPSAGVVTLPAPIGGWNARDAISAMAPADAITLDNFIPDTGGVRLREGYASHATGLGGPVHSLMEYNGPSGTLKLFGATSDTIWDCTSAGAASSAVTGLTNGKWQHCMFATSGGNFLVCANGADDVRNYDGSSWTSPSISNVTSATLIGVTAHVSRLWFVQEDTLDAWYLGTSAISGAATKLPLGPFCKLGGYLLAIASWTRDGGAGMDDVAVFITSKGEAVVYSGTDPSSASTWTKVGTFRIPEPIGRRCVVQTGADLALITSQGVLPLSAILPLSQGGAAKVAATDKISGAVKTAYAGAGTAFGWQLIEYPKGQLLILNVPQTEGVTTHQYVMNTQIGAWCRFKNMAASSWSLLGDALYFGGHNGTVYKYGGLYTDAGSEIDAVSIGAYSNLGSPMTKLFTMARPMMYGPDGYVPLVAVRTDYDLGTINYAATSLATTGSFWDEAEWDVASWAASLTISNHWQVVTGSGSVVSVALAISVGDAMRFNSVDLMYDAGGEL